MVVVDDVIRYGPQSRVHKIRCHDGEITGRAANALIRESAPFCYS